MRELLMDVAVAVAVTCVLCLLNEGLKQFVKIADCWLSKAGDEAERNKNEMAARLFETARKLIDTTVYNAVAAMEQTKAKDIREKVKKGIKDRSELEILATDVLYGIKDQLSPDIISIMEGYIKDLDKYIQDRIEASLLQIKNASLYIGVGEIQEESFETTDAPEAVY